MDLYTSLKIKIIACSKKACDSFEKKEWKTRDISAIFSVKDEINKFVSWIDQETYSLEQACGGSFIFPTPERTESVLLHLILPLCLRVGSGRKGQSDDKFVFRIVRNFFLQEMQIYIFRCSPYPPIRYQLCPDGHLPRTESASTASDHRILQERDE